MNTCSLGIAWNPRIEIELDQVRHQVALPPNYPYVPISSHIPPETPARTYPFTLDPFQETAIYCIQRNESVLVSAHTSAGKTVVAEYAIAQGLRDKQRVIYTSPIKVSLGLFLFKYCNSNASEKKLGPFESEISRIAPRIWRCRIDDRRCHDQSVCLLSCHDHRNFTIHVVSRV